eukprot:g1045.t1
MNEVCLTAVPKFTKQDNIGKMLKRLWIREIAEARLDIGSEVTGVVLSPTTTTTTTTTTTRAPDEGPPASPPVQQTLTRKRKRCGIFSKSMTRFDPAALAHMRRENIRGERARVRARRSAVLNEALPADASEEIDEIVNFDGAFDIFGTLDSGGDDDDDDNDGADDKEEDYDKDAIVASMLRDNNDNGAASAVMEKNVLCGRMVTAKMTVPGRSPKWNFRMRNGVLRVR